MDEEKYNIEYHLIGSPEYLSPESILGEEATEVTDFWALGCIIYLFFHGETPFKDSNCEKVYEKIINCEYTLRSDLDPDVKDIIIKLLQVDPVKRLKAFGVYPENHYFNIDKFKENSYYDSNINYEDNYFYKKNISPKEGIEKKTFLKESNTNFGKCIYGSYAKEALHKNLQNNIKNKKENYSDFISGLKVHPFFKSINFNSLHKMKAPLELECLSLQGLNISINNKSNNNLDDLSIFNSGNNFMRMTKNNFNNLYSPFKKGIKNKINQEIINNSIPSLERNSNLLNFTANTNDSRCSTEANEDKSFCKPNQSIYYNNNLIQGASPFKFDENFFGGNKDKINLENEINNNNSFLNFIQEEKRNLLNKSDRFSYERYSENNNYNNNNTELDNDRRQSKEIGDEQTIIIEGNYLFYKCLNKQEL